MSSGSHTGSYPRGLADLSSSHRCTRHNCRSECVLQCGASHTKRHCDGSTENDFNRLPDHTSPHGFQSAAEAGNLDVHTREVASGHRNDLSIASLTTSPRTERRRAQRYFLEFKKKKKLTGSAKHGNSLIRILPRSAKCIDSAVLTYLGKQEGNRTRFVMNSRSSKPNAHGTTRRKLSPCTQL